MNHGVILPAIPDPIIGIPRALGVDLDRDGVAVQVGPKRDGMPVGEGHVQHVAEEWVKRRVQLLRRAAFASTSANCARPDL